jgi:hypothetical protein
MKPPTIHGDAALTRPGCRGGPPSRSSRGTGPAPPFINPEQVGFIVALKISAGPKAPAVTAIWRMTTEMERL